MVSSLPLLLNAEQKHSVTAKKYQRKNTYSRNAADDVLLYNRSTLHKH